MPETRGPELLVGWETADDAAVYAQENGPAIVSTADFITPVVDDAHTFGAIAAANSLSDVYAMGGRPIMALNLCGFPEKDVPPEIIGAILTGAAEICRQAGVAVAGGHTVRDDEIKFGLAVTGLVDPAYLLRNCTAKPGDALILTKRLGTGALASALKQGRIATDSEHATALIDTMTQLNHCGPAMARAGAHACTDINGFGLTGHAMEMAVGSNVMLKFDVGALPLLPDAIALCGEGFTCGGTGANARYTAGSIKFVDCDKATQGLLNDPQTSGGLLIAVSGHKTADFLTIALDHGAEHAKVIGTVAPLDVGSPHISFE